MDALYAEYRLWYVPPNIIVFAQIFGVDMSVTLGYHANVREALELMEMIEPTRF